MSIPLARMYCLSFLDDLKRERNLDLWRAVRAGGDFVGHIGSVFGAGVPCAVGKIANDNRMFSVGY